MKKWDPNWTTEKVGSWASNDNYWAGAKKACDDIGMSLPDKSKLQSLYEQSKKDPSLGLPTSGWFWSSSEYNAYYASSVYFITGSTYSDRKGSSSLKVLCVGDQIYYKKRPHLMWSLFMLFCVLAYLLYQFV